MIIIWAHSRRSLDGAELAKRNPGSSGYRRASLPRLIVMQRIVLAETIIKADKQRIER